jgi:hypothetical protein
LGKALMVYLLIFLIGGHWGILQSVAWARMVVQNLRSANFTEAVSKTFDGKHPCKLCKAVAEGKKSEKRQATHQAGSKLELFCESTRGGLPESRFATAVSSMFYPLKDFQTAPPIPPPRVS